MLRRATCISFFLTIATVSGGQLHAQDVPLHAPSRTIRTLTAGPSLVDFESYGGSMSAVVGWFSIARVSESLLGTEGALFLTVPLEGASAISDCPPPTSCPTRSTPSLLYGAMISGLARPGDNGLRAAFGIGGIWAAGGEGLENRSSITGHVGVDWVGKGKYALTVTVRLLLLASPIAGARQVFLPGIGVTF